MAQVERPVLLDLGEPHLLDEAPPLELEPGAQVRVVLVAGRDDVLLAGEPVPDGVAQAEHQARRRLA